MSDAEVFRARKPTSSARRKSETCETCRRHLQRLSANERDIYELERERARRVHYRIERKICPQRRKTVRGQVGNALPRAGLSNALIVEIAEQHYVLGRALGQIAERFGLPDATVTASLQRVGKLLQPCLGQLIALYRAAAARHADETGWRTDGGNGWSWYFGGAGVRRASFPPDQRPECMVREVLGLEQLDGVLVRARHPGVRKWQDFFVEKAERLYQWRASALIPAESRTGL